MDDAIAPEQQESPVKWFELFYDLVFVAAIVTFSDAITARPTIANLAWVTFAFIMMWLVWFATTFRFNHDRRDAAVDRFIIVVQMAALSVCAIALGEGPGEERTLVAVSFGIVLMTLAALSWRSGSARSDCTTFFRIRTMVLVVVTACVLLSAVAPESWYSGLWAVAGLTYLGFWVLHHGHHRWPVPPLDVHHLAERFGLLTIVVLGEAFVKLAIVASGGDVSGLDVEVGISMFVCIFGIFWAYFDDVPRAGIAADRTRRFALFAGHLVMQTGCIGLAVGLAYLVKESTMTAAWRAGLFAGASVAVVYLGLAVLGPGTCRRPIRSLTVLRVGTAFGALAVVGAIAAIGDLNPNVIAYVLAALILVHGALAQRLVNRTTVRTAVLASSDAPAGSTS